MKTSTVIITIALIAAGGLFAAKKLFKDESSSPKNDAPQTEPPKTSTTASNKNATPFAMTQSQYEKNAGIATTAFTGLNYTSQGQGVSFGSGRVSLSLDSIGLSR